MDENKIKHYLPPCMIPDGGEGACEGFLWMKETIDLLREDVDTAKGEADALCMAIYDLHFKAESPNFELCDSTAGVISQIDNMVAGLLEKSEAEVERLLSIAKKVDEDPWQSFSHPFEQILKEL